MQKPVRVGARHKCILLRAPFSKSNVRIKNPPERRSFSLQAIFLCILDFKSAPLYTAINMSLKKF